MLTLQEFITFYKTKRFFPSNISSGKASYNDKEVSSKYSKYLKIQKKSQEKYDNRIDIKWEELKEIISKRDSNNCRLYKILTNEEKLLIINQLQKPFDILDGAHVLSRSRRPDLKYDPDNVVLLHRLFHSRIDFFRDPITDKSITEEERIKWWHRVVGEDYYNNLMNK